MSAQKLADATAALGFPIKRSVLSNLESGYRETITVPEIFVLAWALDVPPLALLTPLHTEEQVEVMPGRTVPATDAMLWISGERQLDPQQWEASEPNGLRVVSAVRVHNSQLDRLRTARFYAWDARDKWRAAEDPEEKARHLETAERFERQADDVIGQLRNMRSFMRQQGIVLPELPSDLRMMDLPLSSERS